MRNCEERDRFIKQYSKRRFDDVCGKDEKWNKLRDIPIPERYEWIWEHFIAIWQQSLVDFNGNRQIDYRTVMDYAECMKVPLSVTDKRLIMKMKAWAFEQISEMEPKG